VEVSHIELNQARDYISENIMEPGEVLHGRISLKGMTDGNQVTVQWIDTFGRIAGENIAVAAGPVPAIEFNIPLSQPLSYENRIEVLIDGGRKSLTKDFQIRPEKRIWDDYAAVLWSTHGHETFELLRDVGVTGQIIYRDFPNRETGVPAGMDSYVDNLNWRVFAPYHKWRPKWHAIRDMLERDPYNMFIKVRSPSFEDPATDTAMKNTTQTIVSKHRAHRPLFYNLADEIGIGDQSAPIDLDHSYFARNAFIQYLRNRYGSLERLNRQWEANFDSFFEAAKSPLLLTDTMMDRHWNLYLGNEYDSVAEFNKEVGLDLNSIGEHVDLYARLKSTPPKTEEQIEAILPRLAGEFDLDGVTTEGLREFVKRFETVVGDIKVRNLADWNLSPWMDHRDFTDQSMANALGRARQYGLEADPDGLYGFTGGHSPGAHAGYNLYYLSQAVDVQIPYDIACDVEVIRGMNPDTILMSPTWGGDEKGIRKLWYRFFHGDHGCLFWDFDETDNTFLDKPAHALSERAKVFAPDLKELTNGIGKLVLNSQRQHDRIAIHYSHASLRAHWMIQHLDLGREWRRESWHEFGDQEFNNLFRSITKLIEDGGRQYEFVAAEQILDGTLDSGEFDVLILPQSIAMSDEEADAIRRFVARGGKVIADNRIGLMDEAGRMRERAVLDDVLGIQSSPELKDGINLVIASTAEMSAMGRKAGYLNNFGSGKAFYLDRSLMEYHRDRAQPPAGSELLGVMERALQESGVGKPCNLTLTDGSQAHGTELVRYANGTDELIAIFRNVPLRSSGIGGDIPMDTELFESKKSIRLILSEKRWVYDVRAGQLLGLKDVLELELDPWRPILLSTSPERIDDFVVTADSAKIQPGDTVTFSAKLNPIPAPGETTTRIINLQVQDANGKDLHHYRRNIAFRGGQTSFEFQSARNEEGPLDFSFTLLPSGQNSLMQVDNEH